jgi:hypothetical protein
LLCGPFGAGFVEDEAEDSHGYWFVLCAESENPNWRLKSRREEWRQLSWVNGLCMGLWNPSNVFKGKVYLVLLTILVLFVIFNKHI